MLQVNTIAELRSAIARIKIQGDAKIGFIPTMGNLHSGHLHLVEQSIKSNFISVVSIFVNPTQFNNPDDLSNYPRTLKEDLAKLDEIGCDLVFTPTAQEMYPRGMDDLTQVVPAELGNKLEGIFRPGHFNGMATVVCKLFNACLPDVAFFGQKDFQQLAIVKQMVADLNMPIHIQAVPTQRDESGLALSSRNNLLNIEEKKLAPKLYESLCYIAQNLFDYSKAAATLDLQKQHLSTLGFDVEYLELREASTLEIPKSGDENLVLLIAAKVGQVRLIDNLPIILKVEAL